MRVLHVISSGGMYGAEAVILNLARAMEGGPHGMALGSFDNRPNANLELHQAAVGRGLESHLVLCRGQMDRSAVGRLRELARETGADVVHAHGFKADIYTYLAMRGRGAALVSTCHTWYDTDWRVRLYGALDRFVLRRYVRVVAVSEEVRGRLLRAGVDAARVRMVRNGVDLGPFAGAEPGTGSGGGSGLRAELAGALPAGAPLIGLVGRLAWEKGVDVFVHAAARVAEEFPEARFVIAGEGPERAMVEGLIGELGMGAKVTMLGRRDDMAGVYASLDVMVSASRQEGLPMALLEGMASGRAIVATAVGEVPGLIADGETGMLVAAEDVATLAAGIAGLLRAPERRARLGAEARRRVQEEYSAERMAGEYLRVYEEAVAAVRR
jgi:glycosyltransferase involved in cell wall biosynthesis